ncbi:MAG: hypothetical protein ACE5H3_04700 [Planctomycetota bacterium]
MTSTRCSARTARKLAKFFHRNGYVRWQDSSRLGEEGHHVYKKGDEVRLVADSRRELAEIRRLLKDAGFKPGRPFPKGRQFRQPLYGRDAVGRFLELVNDRS